MLFPGPLEEHRNDVTDDGIDLQRLFLERKLAGLDLGQVEDGVDDGQ